MTTVLGFRQMEKSSQNDDAAIKIQRWWRKYLDVNVYKYYRDLINFRQKGDPGMMLKAINPAEARYLDAAAGIHVKFRLAGENFPPQIYYKIFTHRPIQDIGSFAPRDYTKRDMKLQQSRLRQYRPTKTGEWYRRHENNGWRLVSDRVIHHLLQTAMDPVTIETGDKRNRFHHSTLQRKQDAYERKKQRKLEWMRKVYTLGVLNEGSGEPHPRQNKDPSVPEKPPFAKDITDLDDSEVDELIQWSDRLSFDDYWYDWKEIATTASSDFSIHERLRLSRSLHEVQGDSKIPGSDLFVSFDDQAISRDKERRQNGELPSPRSQIYP